MHASDSLAHLATTLRHQTGKMTLIPTDDEWYSLIHLQPSNNPLQPQNFSTLLSAFTRCAKAQDGTLGASTHVVEHMNRVILNARPFEFNAPMCCPLTRNHIAAISNPMNEYLVTEKSDGLRAILVYVLQDHFPRWTISPSIRQQQQQDDSNGKGPTSSTRSVEEMDVAVLYDVAVLEAARHELLQTCAAETEHPLKLSTNQQMKLTLKEGSEDDSSVFVLANPKLPKEDHRVVRRDKNGQRGFVYLFDRRLGNPYLLLDEIRIPGVAAAVVDGEIIQTIPRAGTEQRTRFLAFDLFTYTPLSLDDDGSTTRGDPVILNQATQLDRSEQLRRVITDPLKSDPKARRSEKLTLIAKHMYRLHELTLLLDKITVVDGRSAMPLDPLSITKGTHPIHSVRFAFEDCTMNDGLIFTPNRFDLTSGSHEDQLKWKWPHQLTVDFLLSAAAQAPPTPKMINDEEAVPSIEWCTASLFFRRRNKAGPDQAGHMEVTRTWFLNPQKHRIPFDSSLVAECSFTPYCPWKEQVASLEDAPAYPRGVWQIEKIRQDKMEANSIIAATSVLESVAECLDLQQLLTLLGLPVAPRWVRPASGAFSPPPRTPEEEAQLRTNMLIRAMPDSKLGYTLRIQWQVRIPGFKALTCNHRRVSECFGLGEPCPEDTDTSNLEGKILLALANVGGSVGWSDLTCEVRYHPNVGRWEIIRLFDPDKEPQRKGETFAYALHLYLERLAAQAATYGVESTPGAEIARTATEKSASSASLYCFASATERTNLHYTDRTKALRLGEDRSFLRLHNNWIKSVLLDMASTSVGSLHKEDDDGLLQNAANGGSSRIRILDLCAGRGGDLAKYKALGNVEFLLMADSCFSALAEAAGRYSIGNGLSTKSIATKGIKAAFSVVDCFDSDAVLQAVKEQCCRHSDVFPAANVTTSLFDVVACQFSMHYAFDSEVRVRGFLRSVQQSLRVGGVFLATTVDSEAITTLRQAKGDSVQGKCFSIRFVTDDAEMKKLSGDAEASVHRCYGTPYVISLDAAVQNEMEFTVDWEKLSSLAKAEFGLEVVESMNFAEFAAKYKGTQKAKDVAQSMAEGIAAVGQKRQRTEESARGGSSTAATAAAAPVSAAAEAIMKLAPDEAMVAALFRTILMRRVW